MSEEFAVVSICQVEANGSSVMNRSEEEGWEAKLLKGFVLFR